MLVTFSLFFYVDIELSLWKQTQGDTGGQFFPSVFIASQRAYMHYVGVSNMNQ